MPCSSKGLEAVLLQGNHPVAYTSKALTACQKNYAQIENEKLLRKPLYQAPSRLQK